MKQKSTKIIQLKKPISVRLADQVTARLLRIVAISKRSKTSIVEECLAEVLPDLERRYKKLDAA